MSRDQLIRIHQAVAALLAVLVLVMAVIAGRALFGTWEIAVHGYVGNAIFLVVILNMGLVVATKRGGLEHALALAVFLLTFAQIGLGYVGRDTLEAAAWHVPNGVLLMGLTSYQYAVLRPRGDHVGA